MMLARSKNATSRERSRMSSSRACRSPGNEIYKERLNLNSTTATSHGGADHKRHVEILQRAIVVFASGGKLATRGCTIFENLARYPVKQDEWMRKRSTARRDVRVRARWAGAPGAFEIKSRRHLALLQPSHVLHDDNVNVGALRHSASEKQRATIRSFVCTWKEME